MRRIINCIFQQGAFNPTIGSRKSEAERLLCSETRQKSNQHKALSFRFGEAEIKSRNDGNTLSDPYCNRTS